MRRKEYGRTPFIVYRGFRYQNLFDRMADLLSSGKEGEIIGEECREEAYACANELLELAADYGFGGIYGIASYPSALPTMRMPTALPVRSGAIWEVPCPIWQNRISRYLWICLPATSGN